MAVLYNNQEVSSVVLDFDKTFYSSSEELDAKIWGDVRRKLVEKILEVKEINKEDTEAFEYWLQFYINSSKKNSWKTAFIELGGSDEFFAETMSLVVLAEYLTYDKKLVVF